MYSNCTEWTVNESHVEHCWRGLGVSHHGMEYKPIGYVSRTLFYTFTRAESQLHSRRSKLLADHCRTPSYHFTNALFRSRAHVM